MKLRVETVRGTRTTVECDESQLDGTISPTRIVRIGGKTFWSTLDGALVNPDFIVSGERW